MPTREQIIPLSRWSLLTAPWLIGSNLSKMTPHGAILVEIGQPKQVDAYVPMMK